MAGDAEWGPTTVQGNRTTCDERIPRSPVSLGRGEDDERQDGHTQPQNGSTLPDGGRRTAPATVASPTARLESRRYERSGRTRFRLDGRVSGRIVDGNVPRVRRWDLRGLWGHESSEAPVRTEAGTETDSVPQAKRAVPVGRGGRYSCTCKTRCLATSISSREPYCSVPINGGLVEREARNSGLAGEEYRRDDGEGEQYRSRSVPVARPQSLTRRCPPTDCAVTNRHPARNASPAFVVSSPGLRATRSGVRPGGRSSAGSAGRSRRSSVPVGPSSPPGPTRRSPLRRVSAGASGTVRS